MSETIEAASEAVETTTVPEVTEPVTTAAETPETTQATPETTAESAAEAPAPKPGDEPWRKVRIEQITREKHEERRARELAEQRAEAAERELNELRAGRDPDAARLNAAQIEAEAKRLAAQELAAREQDAKNARFLEHGRSIPDFDERCGVVASMGATARPEFMQIIGDMDAAGPQVVMHLADNPQEAMRILRLPAAAMARALTTLEHSLKAPPPVPKAVSKAPKPITPIGGATEGSPDISDPNLSMREYVKLREKQIAAREKARA